MFNKKIQQVDTVLPDVVKEEVIDVNTEEKKEEDTMETEKYLNSSCKICDSNVIFADFVTVGGDNLYLGSSNTITPKNGCSYTVIVPCRSIPAAKTLQQVFVAMQGVNYPLTDFTLGNLVYNDQLRCMYKDRCGNYVFRVVYGSNQPHFKIISQRLPESLYSVQ